ncbi:MAG: hypothetical protein UHH95_01795 [Oscillospiraceae bacterium]|nr:hypothetical protein [Oscillospiraceae bacterium]
MDRKYSVDDILSELENKKTASRVSDDEFSRIMDDILGKKPAASAPSEPNAEKKTEPAPAEPVAPKDVKSYSYEKVSSASEETPKKEPFVIEKHKEKPIELNFSPKTEKQTKPTGDTITFNKDEVIAKAEKKADFKVKIDYEDNIPEPAIDEKEPQVKPDFEDATIQIQPFGLTQAAPIEPEPVTVNKELAEFRESRKQKVEKFVLFGDEEEDNDPEPVPEPAAEVKTIEDFNDYSESTAIIKDLSGIKAGLTLRLIVLSALTLLSAYIELGSRINIPMPDMFSRSAQPLSYLIVSALIFVAAVLVSAPAVFGGFSSLFGFKADGDSLLAVSALGAAVQYIALFASPLYLAAAKNTIFIYGFIAILNMFFNTVGKLLIIKRVRLNFRFVSGGYEKYAVTLSESEKLDNFVKEQFDMGYSSVAVPKKTDFIGGFLGYSYREDICDNISKVISPILALGALVLSVISFVLIKDFQKAASTFAAVTAICAPVSTMLAINLPLMRTAKKLVSRGSMISGLPACNEVYDTNCVLVKSADLFPKGSIQLSAIKTFAAGRIDEVILDAASVVIRAESDLSEVFLSVIGGRKDLLRSVDSIVYEESMGLSAWVDSKRVLIGNRELIRHHGIDVPSKDYEDRYLNSGMDMVYLAESGELVAVFLIQYKPGVQIKKAMKALESLDIGVVVASTDPNINAQKIARIFDVDRGMIKTVPADKQGETEKVMRQSSRENVGAASISSFSAFAQTIYAAIKLKSVSALAVALQTVGVILGFAVTAFFTVMSGSVAIPIEGALLYQLFWLAAVSVIPSFKNVKI